MLTRADNPLVRAVARVPTTVNRKLLVAFTGIVGLLVVVGVLGLRVLGGSNDRITTLGALQQRLAAYRGLQTEAAELRLLIALRVSGADINAYVGASPAPGISTSGVAPNDDAIQSTMKVLGPLTDPANLRVEPPPDEKDILGRIRQDYAQLATTMTRLVALDQAGKLSESAQLQSTDAEPRINDLESLADQLVSKTEGATNLLIAQNQSSYLDSQHLFIAAATGSVILALVLGFVLSWSLIGPIQRMSTRLAGIASGDFSAHVEVRNRDELGALASNLNRMNDELGRLYAELESASRHKSEFLANMSHELRTPLNAIIGFSQVLNERMFGDLNEKQAEYVDDILTSGQHLLSLINDILDIAKVESGRMDLEPAVFPLPAALQTAVAMVRERATRQGVSVTTDIDDSVGLIEADERKVKQILFNLLSNAVKFTPTGGRVAVVARADSDRAEISISDTGVGIRPEDLGEIFEEFRQVGPGKTLEGTGLGLPLAKRLVEMHGGEMRVESVPAEGSTFTFTLPLHQQTDTAETPPEAPTMAVAG